jgi:hypothetical protein
MNKNIVIIVIGFIVLIIAAICPLPMILGISGIAWRLIIGLLGCFSLVLGIYKISRNK